MGNIKHSLTHNLIKKIELSIMISHGKGNKETFISGDNLAELQKLKFRSIVPNVSIGRIAENMDSLEIEFSTFDGIRLIGSGSGTKVKDLYETELIFSDTSKENYPCALVKLYTPCYIDFYGSFDKHDWRGIVLPHSTYYNSKIKYFMKSWETDSKYFGMTEKQIEKALEF